jgi:hypothetical protein
MSNFVIINESNSSYGFQKPSSCRWPNYQSSTAELLRGRLTVHHGPSSWCPEKGRSFTYCQAVDPRLSCPHGPTCQRTRAESLNQQLTVHRSLSFWCLKRAAPLHIAKLIHGSPTLTQELLLPTHPSRAANPAATCTPQSILPGALKRVVTLHTARPPNHGLPIHRGPTLRRSCCRPACLSTWVKHQKSQLTVRSRLIRPD